MCICIMEQKGTYILYKYYKRYVTNDSYNAINERWTNNFIHDNALI